MKIAISHLPIANLTTAKLVGRKHSAKQEAKLRRLIERYGFLVPIVVDQSGRIICGHLRVKAAKSLGFTEVPAIEASHLTPAEIEAFALAENRISDDGAYDKDALREIFLEIKRLDIEFDLADTAFDAPEIDFRLVDPGHDDEPVVDSVNRSKPAVSRPGDTWQIGRHIIGCGDARDPEAYQRVLGDEVAQLVIADPPYNLTADAITNNGTTQHADFVMAAGEMSPGQFTAFLSDMAARLVAASGDGSIHFLFMDYRHMGEMLAGAGPHYTELKNLCVWVKRSGGMGSLYRGQHELVFVFKAGAGPHINNVELGQNGRNRTNVWEYAGANSFGAERDALKFHPTPKNVEMLADAILDCSHRDGAVLDPFLGSGSTILAAHRTGRRGHGIELDPYYVDVAVQRISQAVEAPALLVATGEPFEAVADRRANPGWGQAA